MIQSWQSRPSIAELARPSWDALRDGDTLVQGFNKERAAVGCVALQSQLTPLICSRSSSFRALTGGRGPGPHYHGHSTCFSAHTSNQLRLALHIINAGHTPVCGECYWSVEGNRDAVKGNLISHLFSDSSTKKPNKLNHWSPAGDDTPETVSVFSGI